MVAISRVWYNGSYKLATKPIKFLKLHSTIIQFLINNINHKGRLQERRIFSRKLGFFPEILPGIFNFHARNRNKSIVFYDVKRRNYLLFVVELFLGIKIN